MTILSIVTGTYNRIGYLQRMIASVRSQIPRHIQTEYIIVDGGSTDGTQEWCDAQPEIRFINHGELRGAIRAFCEGAHAATGDYVIMANDDIEFHPGSIMRAVAYLEEHRDCGAVAFADNRSQLHGHASRSRVEKMPAIGADGKPATVNYAQVGMFRRWIGERCGWWGADDEYMRNSRTYGGDNYLSARIWEMGYTVDSVDGCQITDRVADDALRAHGRQVTQNDSAQYYTRYPRGPFCKAIPTERNPQRERLRIVLMDIHEPRLPAAKAREKGLADALAKVGLLWHIDYINEPYDLPEIVRTFQPHVLITQMHDTSRINAKVYREARAQNPGMVIVNWFGDAYLERMIAPDMLEALKEVDLQTIVNMTAVPIYEKAGIPCAYWQIGWKQESQPYQGDVPIYDVLWQGNAYDDRRLELVRTLQALNYDVGVYGSCPGAIGNSHYDFALQAALYSRARLTVGDTYPGTIGFVSNRLFQALGAGAFLLQQHSPRLDELTGLKAGIHYVEWCTLDDLKLLIDEWLDPSKEKARLEITEMGKAFVRTNFSYAAQVEKLWTLLPG